MCMRTDLSHVTANDEWLHYSLQLCSDMRWLLHCFTGQRCSTNATILNSDNSRRQLQSSDSTIQSVYSTDDVQVDDSDQLDAAGHHKLSNTGDNNTGVFDAVVSSSQRQIVCEVCNKRFMQPCNLKKHMLVHTGKHPFSCKVCKKMFTHACYLKAHMVVHTGERPFSCDVCGKKYKQSSTLYKHMYTHAAECPSCSKVCDRIQTSNTTTQPSSTSTATSTNVSCTSTST